MLATECGDVWGYAWAPGPLGCGVVRCGRGRVDKVARRLHVVLSSAVKYCSHSVLAPVTFAFAACTVLIPARRGRLQQSCTCSSAGLRS
ncbi:hypothetical protein BD310DRAFT_931567 [Dichomitus squalens]|uniref:Uncharacterized protein n=1 Tax=Dichomitus squalens TaxID=114155 RepID=A0A4Q9PPV7_9APHY|nr:hypothetical protein BD310DRAFT_931567 [Dichomitus squalens]